MAVKTRAFPPAWFVKWLWLHRNSAAYTRVIHDLKNADALRAPWPYHFNLASDVPVNIMKGDRHPRQLLDQVWEVKPCRGRQRKMWGRRVDGIFKALLLDKEGLLDDTEKGNGLYNSHV